MDKEQIIKVALAVYKKRTESLIEFLKAKGNPVPEDLTNISREELDFVLALSNRTYESYIHEWAIETLSECDEVPPLEDDEDLPF